MFLFLDESAKDKRKLQVTVLLLEKNKIWKMHDMKLCDEKCDKNIMKVVMKHDMKNVMKFINFM